MNVFDSPISEIQVTKLVSVFEHQVPYGQLA